jgi:hypothetical protein
MGLRDIVSWLVANDTVAIVTWIGCLAAVVGLPATFKQAQSARKAANAAEDAVKALEDRLNLANLAFAYSQIESIRVMVVGGNSAAAQMLFGPVKRTIIEACQLLSSRTEISAKVEVARKSLRTVERQLGLAAGASDGYRASALTKALAGLSDFLAETETDLKFPVHRS